MSLADGLRHRLHVLLRGDRFARDLDEELRFHLTLDAMQREHAARGALSAADARLAARRRFGNMTSLTEDTRRMAGLGFLDVVRQDVRFALRSFGRTPGFTAVAVLTLAIGIGANTAIFSAVDAMLLRPLPFREPERLMKVSLTVPPRGDSPMRDDVIWSYPKFVAFRDAQTMFEDLALWTDDQFTVSGADEASREYGEVAGARYLPTLGIQPVLGRNFLPEEDRTPGTARVVLLSAAYWSRRFNADPAVLGRPLDINGDPYTVVGVLPAGFKGLSGRADLWVPLMSREAEELKEAWSHSWSQVARLKRGVSAAQAKRAMPQLGKLIDATYPHPEIADEHWGAVARELDATRVDPVVRRSLLVLLGAVGIVLLIACANVANLFLVRASARRREIAVRLAVGAARRRLVRQLLTESVLLSSFGGAASLLLAWWGVKLLSVLQPDRALRLAQVSGIGAVNFESIRLDVRAFAVAAALALLTGIVFGLVPALQATRPTLTEDLKEGSARPRGSRGVSSRNVLAMTEISLALVLLVGSGLMLRSLGKLVGINPGFDAPHVLTVRLNAPNGLGRDSLPGFYDRVLERLSAIPGVRGVGLLDCPPLNGGCSGTSLVHRDRPPVAPGSEPEVGVHWVSPQWMNVVRTPLLRGRLFTDADRAGSPKVVLISETAARRYWPGEDPIGRPVSVGQGGFWQDTARVIGVVGDVRYGTLDSLPAPDVYISYYQSMRGRMMIFVRTDGDPTGVAQPVRRALHELTPTSPVYDLRTLESRVADAMSYARFSTVLLALFALVALALATMGTYGVISFTVAQRTREIGIRMALGARRGDVVRLVVRQGVGLVAVGGVVGLFAAVAASRVLRSLLYDVAPSDPTTFLVVFALLLLAVIVASWIPARRAAGVQPTVALREM